MGGQIINWHDTTLHTTLRLKMQFNRFIAIQPTVDIILILLLLDRASLICAYETLFQTQISRNIVSLTVEFLFGGFIFLSFFIILN